MSLDSNFAWSISRLGLNIYLFLNPALKDVGLSEINPNTKLPFVLDGLLDEIKDEIRKALK